MNYSPVKKQIHVGITASQKQDLYLYKEQNAKAIKVDILAYFKKDWGGSPST